MDSFFAWIRTFFGGFFKFRLFNYQRRLESKVRHATVGKAQAKMHQQMRKVDNKVNRAQDNILPGKKAGPKNGPPAPGAKPTADKPDAGS